MNEQAKEIKSMLFSIVNKIYELKEEKSKLEKELREITEFQYNEPITAEELEEYISTVFPQKKKIKELKEKLLFLENLIDKEEQKLLEFIESLHLDQILNKEIDYNENEILLIHKLEDKAVPIILFKKTLYNDNNPF